MERKEGGKEVDGERTENKVRRRVFPQWEMMPPGWIPPKGTPAGALPAPHAGAAGAGRAEGEDEVERKGGGKEVELWPTPPVGRPVALTRPNEAASPQPQQPNSDPQSYAEYLQQRDGGRGREGGGGGGRAEGGWEGARHTPKEQAHSGLVWVWVCVCVCVCVWVSVCVCVCVCVCCLCCGSLSGRGWCYPWCVAGGSERSVPECVCVCVCVCVGVSRCVGGVLIMGQPTDDSTAGLLFWDAQKPSTRRKAQRTKCKASCTNPPAWRCLTRPPTNHHPSTVCRVSAAEGRGKGKGGGGGGGAG